MAYVMFYNDLLAVERLWWNADGSFVRVGPASTTRHCARDCPANRKAMVIGHCAVGLVAERR